VNLCTLPVYVVLIFDCSQGYIGSTAIYMCRVHKRFREVSPDLVPKSMTGSEPVTVTVPLEKMEKLPELRVCYSFKRNVFLSMAQSRMFKNVSEKSLSFHLFIFKIICNIEAFLLCLSYCEYYMQKQEGHLAK
jgi:hypothetical protein